MKKNVSERLLWVIYFALVIGIYFLVHSGLAAQATERHKWNQFLECSKDQGDWGCDSCYHAIYGVWAENPGYLDYRECREQ